MHAMTADDAMPVLTDIDDIAGCCRNASQTGIIKMI